MGLKYGILIENHALITVNAIGTFLSICYCFVFLKYAVNVRSVYYQALACIFVLTSTLMYVDCWDEDQKIAGEHIGMTFSIFFGQEEFHAFEACQITNV